VFEKEHLIPKGGQHRMNGGFRPLHRMNERFVVRTGQIHAPPADVPVFNVFKGLELVFPLIK